MSAMSRKLKGKAKQIEGQIEEKMGDVEASLKRAKARGKVKLEEARVKRAAKKATR